MIIASDTRLDQNRWNLVKHLQKHAHSRILRHLMRDERLQVIGDRQSLQIAGQQQDARLPSEGEHKPDH